MKTKTKNYVMYHLPEARYNELMDAEENLHRCKKILTELIGLKDGPRDDKYKTAKEAAWRAARELLKQLG